MVGSKPRTTTCSRPTATATHGWRRPSFRWRFEPLVFVALGCNGSGDVARGGANPVAVVADEVLDATVVEQLAARDGLSEADAREAALDTLRLVALARERAAAASETAEPKPLLTPARSEHLRRGALARLWLETRFESEHGPDDIPDDDPVLAQAKASPVYVRERAHRLCQLVAVPRDIEDREAMLAKAAEPAWRAEAKRAIDRTAEHIRRYVPPDDPEACDLMRKVLGFSGQPNEAVTLRIESQAFVLDACAERDANGGCIEGRWASEWVEQVQPLTPHSFSEVFGSRFGWHLVYLEDILPARSLDDPEVELEVRTAVLPKWRAAALQRTVEQLRQKHAIELINVEGPS